MSLTLSRYNIQSFHETPTATFDERNSVWVWTGSVFSVFDNTYLVMVQWYATNYQTGASANLRVNNGGSFNQNGFTVDLNRSFQIFFTIPDAEEYKVRTFPNFRLNGTSTVQPVALRTIVTTFNNSGDSIGIQS